ncbi:hydrogenase small subunit [Heliobacterium undosum]|uniref:Hydrogenase small subunit n=1 Tax=Heliomicrobium undosum TaxID=121734 RepID=A0A845L2E4_9FIRM|nr:hydrogenase small subunit [Heliomicrobium undosum]MZP30727.1 hydrogenase small subunit [Heliomicrobium undosum]
MRREDFERLCRNWPFGRGHALAGAVLPLVRSHQAGRGGGKLPVIWIETCDSGDNNISFLNTAAPYVDQVFSGMIDLIYSNTFMAAQGADALALLQDALVRAGQGRRRYTLVVEGAIPLGGRGRYAVIAWTPSGPLTAYDAVRWLGKEAEYVVALGTCAAFGGPSAARPNPTESVGVGDVLDRTVINVSGCPVNPDWFVGTLAHLLLYGMPELDERGRPVLFYGSTVHRHCQRRSYFDQKVFAKRLGDRECMFSLGCAGPKTYADCPYRLWVDHVSWPVKANTPCIGCTNPDFPDGSTPFFAPLPEKAGQQGKAGQP